MHTSINALYLLAHVAGFVIVIRNYRATRAFFPGAATFLMLAGCYTLSLVIPLHLGVTTRWPGAAWLTLLLTSFLIGTLGDFCLLGLILALVGPGRGGKLKGEVGLAMAVAAVGFLDFYVVAFLDPFLAIRHATFLIAAAAMLVGVAILRRFRATLLGTAAGLGFLVEGVALGTGFLLSVWGEGFPPLVGPLLRIVGLGCWALFLVLLATARTNPRLGVRRSLDTATAPLSREEAGLRWAIFPAILLFCWPVYELLTGSGVASSLTWRYIPLPLVLLFLSWGGLLVWLAILYKRAAPATLDETDTIPVTIPAPAALSGSLRWYQLRPGAAVVFSVVGLLLLALSLVPRSNNHLGEIYPGAESKPIVREFGFPRAAVSSVHTEATTTPSASWSGPGGYFQIPSQVVITYVTPGPKLQWLKSTRAVTFEDGSTTYVSHRDLFFDLGLLLILLVITFAVCKWWTKKR
jgi:hypothetical protein